MPVMRSVGAATGGADPRSSATGGPIRVDTGSCITHGTAATARPFTIFQIHNVNLLSHVFLMNIICGFLSKFYSLFQFAA